LPLSAIAYSFVRSVKIAQFPYEIQFRFAFTGRGAATIRLRAAMRPGYAGRSLVVMLVTLLGLMLVRVSMRALVGVPVGVLVAVL